MTVVVPEPWDRDPLLLTDLPRWDVEEVLGSAAGVLLRIRGRRGTSLVGVGEPGAVVALAREHGPAAAPRWMTVPRGAAELLTGEDLAALGLETRTDWDWFFTTSAPAPQERESLVVELDREAELAQIQDCLAEANPRSDARPDLPSRWFGVRGEGDRLVGVVSATEEGGPQPGTVSWHLQGLAVRQEARGRAWGAALIATVTRRGLAELPEDSWVSLGMYADNDPARRIYDALGFLTHARNSSFRAPAP